MVYILLQSSIFSSLEEDAQQSLADTITPCENSLLFLHDDNTIVFIAVLFSTGETVYSEGEMATYVFLVLKGM